MLSNLWTIQYNFLYINDFSLTDYSNTVIFSFKKKPFRYGRAFLNLYNL